MKYQKHIAVLLGLLTILSGIQYTAFENTAAKASGGQNSPEEFLNGKSTEENLAAPAPASLPEFTSLTNFTDPNYNEHGYAQSMAEYGGYIYTLTKLHNSQSSAVSKRDLNMNLVWNKTYPIDAEDFTIFNEMIFVIGKNYSNFRLTLFKIVIDGTLNSQFQGPSDDYISGSSIDHNSTHVFITYWHRINGYSQGGIACFTTDLEVVWNTQLMYSPTSEVYLSKIKIHQTELYVCGQTQGSGYTNMTLAKYTIDGGFLWDYNELHEYSSGFYSLTVHENSLIVTGRIVGGPWPPNYQCYIGKFSFEGGLIWSRVFGSNDTNIKSFISAVTTKYYIYSLLTDGSLENSSIVIWSHAGEFISDTPISQPGLYYGTETLLLNDIIYFGGTNSSSQARPAYQSLLCTVPPPDAPALGEITPALSITGEIDLQWDAQLAVDNYSVYRSTEPIAEPISIEPIATTSDLYYNDTLLINATYYYAVKAHNLYGSSPLSIVRQVVVDIPTEDPDPEPAQFLPNSPVLSINTESPTTEYSIALVWSSEQAVDNYTLYRLDEPISNNSLPSPAQIKATAVTTTDKNDFVDTVAGPGTYYYAVIARNESGTSNLSNSEYIIVVEVNTPKNETEVPEIAGAPLFGILISGMIIYPIIKRRKRLL
jgi:hypothetical protein